MWRNRRVDDREESRAWSCLCSNSSDRSWLRWWTHVLRHCSMSSSAGLTLVLGHGVICCVMRNLASLVSQSPLMILIIASLVVCTICSDGSFAWRWHGAMVTARMRLLLVKSLDSSEVKAVPLSDTIVSGDKWVMNNWRRAVIIAVVLSMTLHRCICGDMTEGAGLLLERIPRCVLQSVRISNRL